MLKEASIQVGLVQPVESSKIIFITTELNMLKDSLTFADLFDLSSSPSSSLLNVKITGSASGGLTRGIPRPRPRVEAVIVTLPARNGGRPDALTASVPFAAALLSSSAGVFFFSSSDLATDFVATRFGSSVKTLLQLLRKNTTLTCFWPTIAF